MKKISLVAASLMLAATCSWHANAQMTFTADFKPGPPVSDEAVMATTYGCLPMGFSSLPETTNALGATQLFMFEWTIHALGCGNMSGKTLLRFDQMCTLPPTAIIDYAELRLFGVPSSPTITVGNSWYPGTPYSDNPGWVRQVSSPWANNTVTWSTMPGTTAIADPIPVSTTQWNDNYVIPVTAVTNAIWTSGTNYGYLLELQSTAYYRSAIWASSYDPNPANWPELYIEYHLPCNANFNACNSTDNPNTYNFTAEDGTYPDTYTWDFGDGSPVVTGTGATHTYTAPGSYLVCLTLTNADGKVMCQECTRICVDRIVKPCINTDKPASKSSKATGGFPKDFGLDGTIAITSVSPNPTNSVLNVNTQLIAGGDVQYKVYDMTGKEMLHGKNSLGAGKQKMSISVEKLVPGTYVLEMKDNYSKTTTKFTKE